MLFSYHYLGDNAALNGLALSTSFNIIKIIPQRPTDQPDTGNSSVRLSFPSVLAVFVCLFGFDFVNLYKLELSERRNLNWENAPIILPVGKPVGYSLDYFMIDMGPRPLQAVPPLGRWFYLV